MTAEERIEAIKALVNLLNSPYVSKDVIDATNGKLYELINRL